jgi:hypothetical protein
MADIVNPKVKADQSVPKTTTTKSIMGFVLVYFKTYKIGQKHKNLERMLKLRYFSMSKFMVLYFQPFLTLAFSIDHEKHHCRYVMNFDSLEKLNTHNK